MFDMNIAKSLCLYGEIINLRKSIKKIIKKL